MSWSVFDDPGSLKNRAKVLLDFVINRQSATLAVWMGGGGAEKLFHRALFKFLACHAFSGAAASYISSIFARGGLMGSNLLYLSIEEILAPLLLKNAIKTPKKKI